MARAVSPPVSTQVPACWQQRRRRSVPSPAPASARTAARLRRRWRTPRCRRRAGFRARVPSLRRSGRMPPRSSHCAASRRITWASPDCFDLLHLRGRRFREAAHQRQHRTGRRRRSLGLAASTAPGRMRARARASPAEPATSRRAAPAGSTAPRPGAPDRRGPPRPPRRRARRCKRLLDPVARVGRVLLRLAQQRRPQPGGFQHAHQVARVAEFIGWPAVHAQPAAAERAALLRKRGRDDGAGELRRGAQRGLQFRRRHDRATSSRSSCRRVRGRRRCARSGRTRGPSPLLRPRASIARLSVSMAMHGDAGPAHRPETPAPVRPRGQMPPRNRPRPTGRRQRCRRSEGIRTCGRLV